MPISLALLVPQINFIVNNIFLSQLGETSLAAAGITGVYYLIFAVIGSGLNNGLQALISRRAGQNRHSEIGVLFRHGEVTAMIIATLGIAITWFFAPLIMRVAIHSDTMYEQCISFLRIRIFGLPFLYLYAMRNALLVGTNFTKLLVWGTLSETIVNITLDYAMIFGNLGFPALGFNGAAYASIIAEITGLVVVNSIIKINKINQLFAIHWKISYSASTLKLILIQSSPLIAQYAISIVSWEFFYLMIEHHGPRALAISNTMRNIFGMFGIFSWAFASTSNTMVSNLIGQNKEDAVIPLIKRITKLSLGISLTIFCFLNLFPGLLLSFYGVSSGFIEDAIPVIRIVSVALLGMSVGTVWLNAVTGTGNTRVNLLIEAITIILYCAYVYIIVEWLRLPLVYGWGSELVYWISMFSMAWFYMRSGKWKGKII